MTNGDISSPNDDNNNNNSNRTSKLFTTYLNMENKLNGSAPDTLNTNGCQEQSGDWSEQQQLNGEEDANNNNNFCNAQEMMDMRRQLVYLQVLKKKNKYIEIISLEFINQLTLFPRANWMRTPARFAYKRTSSRNMKRRSSSTSSQRKSQQKLR